MANFHTPPNSGTLMGFDVAKFRSHVEEAGIQKPTKWMLSLTVPRGLIGGNNGAFPTNAARQLQFWAMSATIPGAIIVTHDVMRYGYGTAVKRPYSPGFGPMQVGFMADGLGSTWTFFKRWLNLIIHYDVSQGISSNPRLNVGGGTSFQYPYEVSYLDDYQSDVVVSGFVDSGEEILRIALREAYPSTLSDMRVNWADTGGPAQFNVSINYTDWYQVQLPIQSALGVANTP